MRGEDQRVAGNLEDHEETRRRQQRADDIAAARNDLISEARTLRTIPRFTFAWFQAVDHLAAITDRLNELEGDTR